MAKKPVPKLERPSRPVKDWTDAEMAAFIKNSFERYRGTADKWESAVGMLYLGKYMGWKIIHLVHSQATVNQYEAILGVVVRHDFDPTTENSRRSYAWRAIEGFSNFWKAVKGEAKIENARSQMIGSLDEHGELTGS
jgi:hypothetical protein